MAARYTKRAPIASINVYDSDAWGSCAEGIRAAFYSADDESMPMFGVHLTGLDEKYMGADEWFDVDELPADVRAAIEAEGVRLNA